MPVLNSLEDVAQRLVATNNAVNNKAGMSDLQYAAYPNGTDDTATITNASTKGLTLRPGLYHFKGAALDQTIPFLRGVDSSSTIVSIENGGYLFDCNQQIESLLIEGIRFEGGVGVFRNQYTGSNVVRNYIVQDCYFNQQTGTAISHNASDMPYWQIERNTFSAANDTTTMGIALNGLTDKSVIRDNKFYNVAIGVKLNQKFANTVITGNDFIHYTASAGQLRANIWLVPREPDSGQQEWQANVDAGVGTVISNNKFGPENGATTDTRILLAPEGTGALNGDRLPSLTGTHGYVNGLTIENNNLGSQVSPAPELVTSYTPNLVSSVIGRLNVAGNTPPMVLKFAADLPTQHRETWIGPVTRQWATATTESMQATNADPSLFFLTTHSATSGEMLAVNLASSSTSGTTTTTTTSDSTITSAQTSTLLGA